MAIPLLSIMHITSNLNQAELRIEWPIGNANVLCLFCSGVTNLQPLSSLTKI